MPQHFTLTPTHHGAFGALATLAIEGQPTRRFTRQEAAIVSRALAAVVCGASDEPQIYMSPIASDCDFSARVLPQGVTIACDGARETPLDWEETVDLARALDCFGRA